MPLSSDGLASAFAIRQEKRADLGPIGDVPFFHVVTDVPKRAIIARIDRRCCVIFPTQRVQLRRFAFGEHCFEKRQQPFWIAGPPRDEALPWEIRRTAERISDADVAFLIHRDAWHPAVEAPGV